ncbi:MAG: hypothetical protein V4549_07420 [Bacteroidota bacterium]
MTWVAAGIASGAATMAGVQYVKGKRDQKKAEKNRPKYEIPEEAYQNLNQAQQSALQGLPEAQKQQYLNNLQQSSAYALQQTTSRRGGLTGVAAINQQQNQGLQNLAASDAQARMNNQQQLYNFRNQMADYKGQAYQVNKLNPYYEGIAQKQARDAALFQNLNNAAGMGMSGMGGGGKSQQQQMPTQNQYIDNSKYNNMGQGNYNGYDPNYNPQGIYSGGNYDISNIG